MSRAALIPVFVLLALLGGCVSAMCTAELRWGITVRVTAADTGQPLAATVIVRDGDYVEELGETDQVGDLYVAAAEREGTYRIEVSAPGYAPVTVAPVRVDGDDCHVDTEAVAVTLQRP